MCGEKFELLSTADMCVGSPPRVRGKAWFMIMNPKAARITPACAGKSRQMSEIVRSLGDHPRVCGEKRDMPY